MITTYRRLRAVVHDWRMGLSEPWRTLFDFDTLFGAAAGIGMGWWAVHSHAIEKTESGDLYALAGAAVGLLAVTLAVLALLTGFLSGQTALIIRNQTGGTDGFFQSFKVVVFASGLSVIACVAGAIYANSITLSMTGTSRSEAGVWHCDLVLHVGGHRHHASGQHSLYVRPDTSRC
jgi:hypothetical protein